MTLEDYRQQVLRQLQGYCDLSVTVRAVQRRVQMSYMRSSRR